MKDKLIDAEFEKWWEDVTSNPDIGWNSLCELAWYVSKRRMADKAASKCDEIAKRWATHHSVAPFAAIECADEIRKML